MKPIRWIDMWVKILLDAAFRNKKSHPYAPRVVKVAPPRPAGSKLQRALARRGSIYGDGPR